MSQSTTSSKAAVTLQREDVVHIARLAHLALTDAEIDHMREKMNLILGYFQRLDEVDTKDVIPMSHSHALETAYSDVNAPTTSLSQKEALAGAPESEFGHFRVPVVIE